MNAIRMIATNTFRQTVRERLFYNVLLFGIGMVIFSMVVGNLTFGFPDRVVRSIGLSGVSLALDLVALFIGVTLVFQEIDRKTLFVLLTRPVTRWQYVTGRFVGLLLALVVITIGLSAVFTAVLWLSNGRLTRLDFIALLASLPEAAVLGAIGLVLSTFSTPTIGSGVGLGIWLISASTDDLVRLTQETPAAHAVAKFISYVFPNLARFNFREAAVYQIDVALGDAVMAWAYGAAYCAALIALASLIIARREMV
jgi:ABC-type transport system involved in multi-copper enzyme maturation permease subunit